MVITAPLRPSAANVHINREPNLLHGSATLDEALRCHYADSGLPPDGGESARWFTVRMGPVRVPFPNPRARQRALFIHDANHVLTGYNTVFSDGEMSIAAFEVGAGCGRLWVAWLLNLSMMALGALVRPRAVLRAFTRGRRTVSLYTRAEPRAVLRQMRIAELRCLVRLDADSLHVRAGDVGAFLAWIIPLWLLVGFAAAALAAAL